MSLDSRLRRLEGSARRTPAHAELQEWMRGLELDDLRCLLALSDDPEIKTTAPAGVTLDEARARVRLLAGTAPESVRLRLLADYPDL
jgi:hypothetical protein